MHSLVIEVVAINFSHTSTPRAILTRPLFFFLFVGRNGMTYLI